MYLQYSTLTVFLSSASLSSSGSSCSLTWSFINWLLHSYEGMPETPHRSTEIQKPVLHFPNPIVSGINIIVESSFPKKKNSILLTCLHTLWSSALQYGFWNGLASYGHLHSRKRVHHQKETSTFFSVMSITQCQCLGHRLTQHQDWII